ncbi:hypothetical protein PFISCL1PPCAC_4436, partial [Pristionchus fissidentatus]
FRLVNTPSMVTAQSRARNARLAAGREYAAEVVQHCELQKNPLLEEKILGDLSGIVMEAIDCLRKDQPYRSSNLLTLSLELLSYFRQPNKPMLVNFACAFTMLMSELEGIDLAERPRSYSNEIPDVQADVSLSSNEQVNAFSSLPSTSGSAPVDAGFQATAAQRPRTLDAMQLNARVDATSFPSTSANTPAEPAFQAQIWPEEPLGKVEDDLKEEEEMTVEEGPFDVGGYDDSLLSNAPMHNETMQLFTANFSAVS